MQAISLGGWGKGYHNKFYDLSLHVAPVNEAIDIIARAASFGIPYLKDEDSGELTQESPFIDFILNPNKEQQFEEFYKEFVRNLLSGGFSYLEPSSANKANVRRFDYLDSENRPELKVLINDFIEYPNPKIDDFVYLENSIQTPKNFKNILPFWDEVQDPCNYRIGVSRLCSLRSEIDNIILGNKAKTNKIKQSGKFLVTPKTSGLQNQIGLQLDQPVDIKNPGYKQRDLIEDNLQSSGLSGEKNITVTNKEMTVMNVSESIQGYSYDEETKEDRRTIKNTFGIPRELQNIGDDQSKYSDRQQAMLQLFDLHILPLSENFTRTVQKYYIPEEKRKFVLDYSHHPYYELVSQKQEQKIASQVERLVMLREKDMITEDEFKKQLMAYEII